MPEPTKFHLKEAQLADGTIDFYTMLNEPEDATADAIRAKINSLYSEAQANRDHRNLNRRREYNTLLELLPGAKAALLNADKRQRYDAYLTAARAGTNTPDFESFVNDLMGLNEAMEEKTGLLGVQDKPADKGPRVIKAPVQPSTKSPAKQTASTGGRSGSAAGPMPIVGGVGGFLVGAILGYIILQNIIPAILVGIIVGLLLLAILNRKPQGKIGV